jgi:N-acetylglucosamine-6-phosphate deacetylase
MAMTTILNGRLVLGDRIERGRALVTDGPRIVAISDALHERVGVVNVRGAYVLPGLVDIHVHGAMGQSFNDASLDAWQAVLRAHQQAGTTAALATVASAPIDALTATLGVGRQLLAMRAPGLLGVHLEGPYLSQEHRGAHGAGALRSPGDDSWHQLRPFAALLKIVTLAPELPGAEQLIRELCASNVVVSAGHSAASPEVIAQARSAGLSHFAHLWSGQSMLSKRGPWRNLGLLEAALSSEQATAEVIADGVHVPAELAQIAYRCLGPDRMCLISDAASGTGLAVGSRFCMGSAEGVVHAGVALTPDGCSFCGSTSFLSDVLRFCVKGARIPLVDAVRMAATTPARVLGVGDTVGRLAPGQNADLLVLDDDLMVKGVMQGGHWVRPLP